MSRARRLRCLRLALGATGLLLGVLLPPFGLAQPINSDSPLARGLVAWWPVLPHLSNGKVWYDLINQLYGVNATDTTMPTWRGEPTGRFDGALSLNGVQVSIVGDVPRLNFERTDRFSLVGWFASTSTGANFISKFDGANNYPGYWLGSFSAGEVAFVMGSVDGAWFEVRTVASYNDGKLHQLAATYNGGSAASSVVLYVDGRQVPVVTAGPALTASILNTQSFYFGYGVVGRASNVMVYNRVLSATEVRTIAQMRAPTYGGLLPDRAQTLIQSTPSAIPIKRKVTIQ